MERVCSLDPLLALLPGKSADEANETDVRLRNPRIRRDSDAVFFERQRRYAPWRAALAALETDPAAPLPEIELDEPATRAEAA
jgi:hypothetical protein